MASPQLDREIVGKGIARSSFAALDALTAAGVVLPPCPYEHHRVSDWRHAAGGPVVCGVCHPPARGVPLVSAIGVAA